jgi:Fe-S cluster biogenesis protein NfuA
MHVERTDDPTVLRWVCHLTRPFRLPPDPDSALGALLATGRIAAIDADRGDLIVASGPDGWSRDLVATTNDAVRRTLETLDDETERDDCGGASPPPGTPPTIEAVRRAIDRAVGAVASEHGGRIEVVELADDVVVVDLHGACAGCPGAERTLIEVAERVVVDEFPELSRVRARAGATRSVRFIPRRS